jgi:hypothetical protein
MQSGSIKAKKLAYLRLENEKKRGTYLRCRGSVSAAAGEAKERGGSAPPRVRPHGAKSIGCADAALPLAARRLSARGSG